MARRGVLGHPKTMALADELGYDRLFYALGLLEGFWHYAQQYLRTGFIPRAHWRAIARYIDFTEGHDVLRAALVKSGYVDPVSDEGDCIHDWPDHADSTVRKWLKDNGETFFLNPKEGSNDLESLPSDDLESLPSNDSSYPSQAMPSQAKPIQAKPKKHPPTPCQGQVVADAFQHFRDHYPKRSGSYDWPRAERALTKALKQSTLAEIMVGLERYRDWVTHSGKLGSEFVAQPGTWLNRQGWLEEYTHPPSSAPPPSHQGYRPIHEVLDEIEARHA